MAGTAKPRVKNTRLRLLPVLVAVAGLALVARVTDVWQGFTAMAQDKPSAQAQDQAAPSEATDAGETLPGDPGGPAEAAPGADGRYQLPPDPLNMTDQEVDILQSLAERREEIERRATRLEEREILLQAAERRIEEKVAGLQALRQQIEDLLNTHEEQTENQYQSLVKIYENMKPKDAAKIFDAMEMDVLLSVVERMKERKVAPILAKMDTEKANDITTQLAQRRILPAKE